MPFPLLLLLPSLAGAARAGAGGALKKFVHVSTAVVYKSDGGRPAAEGARLGPWTTQAESSLAAEEAVRAVPGLPLVILRPAMIYGPGDVAGGCRARARGGDGGQDAGTQMARCARVAVALYCLHIMRCRCVATSIH